MDFMIHSGQHYGDQPFWMYCRKVTSSTADPQSPGRSKNRKFLRSKMKGTWVDDSYFYGKHFPVNAQTRACACLVKASQYNDVAKRWKRITPKPPSASHLITHLTKLFNTILGQSNIPQHLRLFLKPNTMKASREPLPSPEIILAGGGPAFVANKSGCPIPEYSSGVAPIQVMLESEYRSTKRHLSAVHANEIFQQQDNRRYIYALIFTETYMRMFMFDPAGGVIAPRLNYHSRTAEFCAVIAGIATLDEVGAGFDTSFVLDDQLNPRIWTTERDPGAPPRSVSYLVKSRLFKASKFVSRATGCWLVDTVDKPHKTYVIKDAWIAPSEIQAEMEGSLIAHANDKGVVCGLVRIRHQARILVPGRTEDTVIKNRRIRSGASTNSMDAVQDRIHTRIVMDTYGKPIWKFSSRAELMLAFHDAVHAHRNLYKMAGILHRDVSTGNILINTDKEAKEGNRGILIDLDYAVRLEKLDQGPKTVGTRKFMSRNILQGRLSHSHLDDLESFYYVLCWLICEYDGPGDVSTSRLEKTPDQLKDLDSKDGAEKRAEHMRNSFDLPIQPWFGDIFRELIVHLHGFFHCRTKLDGPLSDPEKDYEEFIGYIRRSVERLGPEDSIPSTLSAGLASEGERTDPLTNHLNLKRKAAEVEFPDKPDRKRPIVASLHYCPHPAPERPRRAKARYKAFTHPTPQPR